LLLILHFRLCDEPIDIHSKLYRDRDEIQFVALYPSLFPATPKMYQGDSNQWMLQV
jgi:hypothetical protein